MVKRGIAPSSSPHGWQRRCRRTAQTQHAGHGARAPGGVAGHRGRLRAVGRAVDRRPRCRAAPVRADQRGRRQDLVAAAPAGHARRHAGGRCRSAPEDRFPSAGPLRRHHLHAAARQAVHRHDPDVAIGRRRPHVLGAVHGAPRPADHHPPLRRRGVRRTRHAAHAVGRQARCGSVARGRPQRLPRRGDLPQRVHGRRADLRPRPEARRPQLRVLPHRAGARHRTAASSRCGATSTRRTSATMPSRRWPRPPSSASRCAPRSTGGRSMPARTMGRAWPQRAAAATTPCGSASATVSRPCATHACPRRAGRKASRSPCQTPPPSMPTFKAPAGMSRWSGAASMARARAGARGCRRTTAGTSRCANSAAPRARTTIRGCCERNEDIFTLWRTTKGVHVERLFP